MTQATRPHLIGMPVLDTERLILRGPLVTDWPSFRDYRASARTVYTGGPKAEPQAAEQFASFFGHWIMRGFGRLIAQDRATGMPVGHFGPMQWVEGAEVEMTWSLWSAAFEGRGLATEAARAMQVWAFGTLGLVSARAEVHAENPASHAIARRLGGRIDPELRPQWMGAGSVYRFEGSPV